MENLQPNCASRSIRDYQKILFEHEQKNFGNQKKSVLCIGQAQKLDDQQSGANGHHVTVSYAVLRYSDAKTLFRARRLPNPDAFWATSKKSRVLTDRTCSFHPRRNNGKRNDLASNADTIAHRPYIVRRRTRITDALDDFDRPDRRSVDVWPAVHDCSIFVPTRITVNSLSINRNRTARARDAYVG